MRAFYINYRFSLSSLEFSFRTLYRERQSWGSSFSPSTLLLGLDVLFWEGARVDRRNVRSRDILPMCWVIFRRWRYESGIMKFTSLIFSGGLGGTKNGKIEDYVLYTVYRRELKCLPTLSRAWFISSECVYIQRLQYCIWYFRWAWVIEFFASLLYIIQSSYGGVESAFAVYVSYTCDSMIIHNSIRWYAHGFIIADFSRKIEDFLFHRVIFICLKITGDPRASHIEFTDETYFRAPPKSREKLQRRRWNFDVYNRPKINRQTTSS